MTWEIFLINTAAVSLLMFCTWVVSLYKQDVSIIDLVWGSGFVLIAWLTWFWSGERSLIHLLLLICTTIWGVRLRIYLTWRKWGEGEDRRYRAIREKYGSAFTWKSLYLIFGFQALVMLIVSLPVQVGLAADGQALPQGMQQAIAATSFLFWLTGFLFESIGDYQMASFKQNPQNQGKVLDTGLWKYTRHPNYFGDFLVWWGLGFMGVALSGQLWILIGPAVMSLFLMRISGVTLLEKDLQQRKPQYADYVESTSAFFPRLPKSD
ncbi:MAG: DUF1295 domain-containing protein [Planctomycetaceae bacterium]